VTRRGAPARTRSTRAARDPYGIGPAGTYVAPALAALALVIIGVITLNLMNGQLPFRTGSPIVGGDNGPTVTPAPSNQVITPPDLTFPGTIAYAKAGNIWVQTATGARQITDSGRDSMPSFAPDGSWIYFIRVTESRGKFPIGGGQQARAWYDLSTPSLMRVKPDGSGATRLLNGRFNSGNSTWFFWLKQPAASPDGKTVTVISDGPNPLQSNVVVQSFNLSTKQLRSLQLPQSGSLGHQDPAWRADGKYLLFVRNGRELNRGAPQIYRYDPATKRSRAMTGPGYLAPAYSPTGAYIAATQSDPFGTDVAILDSSGKEILRVTNDALSFSPVWSPAGDAVAYLHLSGTIVDLKLARLDTTAGRLAVSETIDLTKVSGLDGASRPSWYVPASELPPPRSAAPTPAASSAASVAP
jgi:Tol biopolymer transport system component